MSLPILAVQKLRLLPTLMICTAMLFGVKLGGVWNGMIHFEAGISQARAETPPEDAPAAAMADTQPDGDAAVPQSDGEFAAADDLSELSASEVAILQRLSDRREQLSRRARELDTQQALLAAAEKRLVQRISRLEGIEAEVAALIEKFDAQEEARMTKLVEVYEKMKAKSAAKIFDALDMEVLLAVALRMEEAKMAAVLAKMSPKAAQELTIEMARQKSLPDTAG